MDQFRKKPGAGASRVGPKAISTTSGTKASATRRGRLVDFHRASTAPGTTTAAFQICVVGRAAFLPLLTAAMDGDVTAGIIMNALDDFVKIVKQASPSRLCETCEFEFSATALPTGFLICLPAMSVAPAVVMASGLCATCIARPDLNEAITTALRRVWPDATAHKMEVKQ